MADIEKMADYYGHLGYSERNADARVCQDIILKAISKSNFGKNITVKGGVVMRGITKDVRRATEDLDLDFIRYSLDDDSIRKFVTRLNCLEDISIEIENDKIEALSQQEYRGKRVYIIIKDDTGHSLKSKIDLGVHANMGIEQDKYCFDVCMDDEGASLLINSCEQIFAEKMRSLLRFGPFSTKYKDIFDFCYLKDHVERKRLMECIQIYIFDEPAMKEKNMGDIRRRISATFKNRQFRTSVESSGDRNWLHIDVGEAFDEILNFLNTLD